MLIKHGSAIGICDKKWLDPDPNHPDRFLLQEFLQNL